MSWLQRLRIDKFLLVLILVVIIASIFPCEGEVKVGFEHLTTAAIALLFFMHGAKLSRAAIVSGMGHWKLHLVVFLSTFALFPLLGLGMNVLVPGVLTPTLIWGSCICVHCQRRCNPLSPIPRWPEAMLLLPYVAPQHPVFSVYSYHRFWSGC